MAMTGGIGYEIDQLAELGVPELMRRQQIDPQLKYALALQEATKMVEAAARERDMAQPMPAPANVVGQMETNLAKRLAPGVQQQGRRSMQMRNRAAIGLPGQAAPNLARMAMGGIVGYQEGGDVMVGPPEPNMLQRMGQGLKNMGGNMAESSGILREAKAGIGVPYEKRAAVMQQVREEVAAESQNRDPNFVERMGQKLMDMGLNVEESKAILKKVYDDMGKTYEEKAKGMAMGGVVGYQEGGAVDIDALLDSLMMAESGGNPRAVSEVGAEGAYQIMPSTAADPGFGVSPMEGSRFDPEASRKFAKQYLQAMIDRYDGDMEAALVAYNAGPGNADKFVAAGKDYDVLPQAMQTKPYVERVMGQISPQRSYERAPEGGLSTLALDPVKPRRFEAPAPVTVRDTSEDVASMLERIDPAAAPKEADMMRTVSKRDAEKQRAVSYLQGIGRAQDSQRDREAAGGLSYIKALADAEAAQKANALRYLQQAGKFQEMQGDTENMLAALDPAAEGVKGFNEGGGVTGFLRDLIAPERESLEGVDLSVVSEENPLLDVGMSPSELIEPFKEDPVGATANLILGAYGGAKLLNLSSKALKPVVQKYGPAAVQRARDLAAKAVTTPKMSGPGSAVRGPKGKMMSAEKAREAGVPLNRQFSPGRTAVTGALAAKVADAVLEDEPTGPLEEMTVPTRQEAFAEMFPEALSAAQTFEVRKGLGTEQYPEGAPLKNPPKKGLAGLLSRIDMGKVADVAQVLGRGAGASKGFEAAKIVEESAKARAIQEARQDQLDKLRQQLDVEREKIDATRGVAESKALAALSEEQREAVGKFLTLPATQTRMMEIQEQLGAESVYDPRVIAAIQPDIDAYLSAIGMTGSVGNMPGLPEGVTVKRVN